MRNSLILIALLTLFLSGCTAHSFLEPLGKGNKAVRVAFGGPIVAAFGTHVPVPFLAAGGELGLNDNVNVGGDLHIFPLFYEIAGAEAGAMWFPLSQAGMRPTIGIGGRLLMMGSFRSGVKDRFRAYPIVSMTTAWRHSRRLYYLGNDLTLPLTEMDYDPDGSRAIFSPFVGCKWKLGKGFALGFELKWQAANLGNDQTAVEYTGIGSRGALAPLFTLEKTH